MFGFRKKSRVQEIKKYELEGDKTLSLLEIQGPVKDQLVEHFRQLGNQDSSDCGAVSPKSILSLIGGATVSGVGSAALSSNLFVATVNPATLMQIGNGVGSAVMGSSGIIGQAAFIPAATAVLPIALPVIAFQAMTTLVILKQFNVVNKKLDGIDRNIRKILKRDEASFAGEILYANKQVDLIERQISISKKFTLEMLTNLCVIQNKVGPSFERYRVLYESENLNSKTERDELKQKHHDSHFMVAFSILELRIDLLKIKLAVQDAPEQLELLVEQFKEKSESYKILWEQVKLDPKLAKDLANDLEDAIVEMNWWQRNMPKGLFGKRKDRKEKQVSKERLGQHSKDIEGSIDQLIEVGESITTNEKPISLIYWTDHLGEHSYYTTELDLPTKKTANLK